MQGDQQQLLIGSKSQAVVYDEDNDDDEINMGDIDLNDSNDDEAEC